MSGIFIWTIVVAFYLVGASVVAVFCAYSDPAFWQSSMVLLHAFNICTGILNLWTCVNMGMRDGWKA